MCEGLSTIVNGPIPPHPMFLLQREETSLDLNTSRSNKSICEGPSKLSGPIGTHFGNDQELANKSEIDYAMNPRVRNAGKSNFLSDKKGNGVAMLIELQGRAITPMPFKMRDTPKNHIASNTIKIKQLMRKVKEREQQKEKEKSEKNLPVKALWKSEKYKDVQSKLKEMLQQQPLAPRVEVSNQNFLRAHSKTGSRPQSARQAPKENDLNMVPNKKFASKDDLDFIKHNQLVAKQAQIKRAPSMEMLKYVQEKLNKDLEIYQTKIKGKIPTYLEQRKNDVRKEMEAQIKNMPDPDQPPGHRKLPEEEREKTLNLLFDAQKKMLSELNSLPIRNDTFRIRTTKNEMEKKLTEVEEAIKLFSKPKVFVKVEN